MGKIAMRRHLLLPLLLLQKRDTPMQQQQRLNVGASIKSPHPPLLQQQRLVLMQLLLLLLLLLPLSLWACYCCSNSKATVASTQIYRGVKQQQHEQRQQQQQQHQQHEQRNREEGDKQAANLLQPALETIERERVTSGHHGKTRGLRLSVLLLLDSFYWGDRETQGTE